MLLLQADGRTSGVPGGFDVGRRHGRLGGCARARYGSSAAGGAARSSSGTAARGGAAGAPRSDAASVGRIVRGRSEPRAAGRVLQPRLCWCGACCSSRHGFIGRHPLLRVASQPFARRLPPVRVRVVQLLPGVPTSGSWRPRRLRRTCGHPDGGTWLDAGSGDGNESQLWCGSGRRDGCGLSDRDGCRDGGAVSGQPSFVLRASGVDADWHDAGPGPG